jgi:hypothetical protein
MSTSIIYKQHLGTILTPQQILIQDDYTKEVYENGVLKRIEYFQDFKISYSLIFLSPNESIIDIVDQYKNHDYGNIFCYNKQQVGTYTVWDFEEYNGTIIKEKGKRVFDLMWREICMQSIDIATLEVISTEKIFYLNNFDHFNTPTDLPDYGTIHFSYKQDKIIVYIGLLDYELDSYIITPENNILLNSDISELFSWENETYYHSAEPLIPGQ